MSLIQNLRALLARPVLAPPPRQAPTRRHGRAETSPPLELAQLTVAELEQAIADAFAERQRTEQTLADAAAEREKLLSADDDDAVVEADKATNLAAITLEKLDRIEPQLRARLREVRRIEKSQRFAAARDRLIPIAEALLPALRPLAEATEAWRREREAVINEFPGSENWVPGIVMIPPHDVEWFAADIERFRNVVLDTTPQKLMTSEADAIAEARRTGVRPHPSMPHAPAVERALAQQNVVILLRTWQNANGQTVKPGTEVGTTFDEAQALVQRGFAKWKEPK